MDMQPTSDEPPGWSKPCIACQFDLHRTIMGHNHNADLMADHKALFVTVLAKITLNMHVYEVLTVSEFLSSYVVLIYSAAPNNW